MGVGLIQEPYCGSQRLCTIASACDGTEASVYRNMGNAGLHLLVTYRPLPALLQRRFFFGRICAEPLLRLVRHSECARPVSGLSALVSSSERDGVGY